MYKQGERSEQSQDTRNFGVLRSWLNRWVWASYANYDKIEKEMVGNKAAYKRNKMVDKEIEKIKTLNLSGNELKKAIDDASIKRYGPKSLLYNRNKHKGEPALIVGAGISLEKLIPLLKDWKGVIFTSESMAATLKYYGHQPEYICLFDGGQTVWDTFFHGQNFKGSTLVTHPSVDPKVIELWKGKKIYYLMMHFAKLFGKENFEGKSLPEMEKIAKGQLLGHDFFENIIPSVYSMIGASILNAGCVVNNAVEVANFMGFGPLFLCGVDFGFKDWIDRYPKVSKVNGKWVKAKTKIVEHEDKDGKKIGDINVSREIIMSDNGMPTTAEQAEYKLALLSVYKLDRPQLFDCSDGIITELPKLDIKEVVEKNGKGFEGKYRTNEEIVKFSNAYFNR